VRGGRGTLAVLAAAASLLAGAGCGEPGADLFIVTRTGQGPGAALTLRVADDGFVRCNGGPRRRMSDPQLLLAREIQRALGGTAKRSYAPGPSSVFTYRVRLEDGAVAFSDTSPGITEELRKAAAFTREVATGVCRLAR
jgi:hypothetical protein